MFIISELLIRSRNNLFKESNLFKSAKDVNMHNNRRIKTKDFDNGILDSRKTLESFIGMRKLAESEFNNHGRSRRNEKLLNGIDKLDPKLSKSVTGIYGKKKKPKIPSTRYKSILKNSSPHAYQGDNDRCISTIFLKPKLQRSTNPQNSSRVSLIRGCQTPQKFSISKITKYSNHDSAIKTLNTEMHSKRPSNFTNANFTPSSISDLNSIYTVNTSNTSNSGFPSNKHSTHNSQGMPLHWEKESINTRDSIARSLNSLETVSCFNKNSPNTSTKYNKLHGVYGDNITQKIAYMEIRNVGNQGSHPINPHNNYPFENILRDSDTKIYGLNSQSKRQWSDKDHKKQTLNQNSVKFDILNFSSGKKVSIRKLVKRNPKACARVNGISEFEHIIHGQNLNKDYQETISKFPRIFRKSQGLCSKEAITKKSYGYLLREFNPNKYSSQNY